MTNKKTDWWEGVNADFDRRTAEVCIRIGKEPSEEKKNKKIATCCRWVILEIREEKKHSREKRIWQQFAQKTTP
jgi:hypothetical protein